MKKDIRLHTTKAACARSYDAFIKRLRDDGWLQFTLPEANKELCAHDAARQKVKRR